MKHDIHRGIKGLIFDLDGTLADTLPYHFKAWKKVCSRYGAEIEDTFLYKYTGHPSLMIADEIIRKYGIEKNISIEMLYYEKTEEFYTLQHLVKPIPAVAEIAKKYSGLLPMAIGTGGHREAVIRTLEATGLSSYFSIIVTADDISHFKPHPETFLKCSLMMKIAPTDIEVFEDTDLGLQAAVEAGMKATDVRIWKG